MTVRELRQELESFELAGFGDVKIYAYDAEGEWAEVQAEQLVGECGNPETPQDVTAFFICSPEDV